MYKEKLQVTLSKNNFSNPFIFMRGGLSIQQLCILEDAIQLRHLVQRGKWRHKPIKLQLL